MATNDMVFHYTMSGAMEDILPTGNTAPVDIATCDSAVQLLPALPDNPSCKAAVIIVGGRSSGPPEAVPHDELLDTIARACIPIAAIIRGDCRGTDLFIACACHFRFAATHSTIHFPDITRLERLGELLRDMGIKSNAVTEALSGKSLAATEAMKHGFIDSITEEPDIRKRTSDFLQSLVRNKTPQCIRSAMRSIRNGFTMPIGEALREESRIFDERVRESAGEATKTLPDTR